MGPMITVSLIFFVGCMGLLFAAGQIFVKPRRLENYNLFLLFICLGLLLFQFGFIFNGTIFLHPSILYLHLTLLALIGPLLSYAFSFISFPEEKPGKKLFFLVPVGLLLIPDTVFLFLSHSQKVKILEYLFLGSTMQGGFIIKILIVLKAANSSAGYIILLLKLLPARKVYKLSDLQDKMIFYSIVFIINIFILNLVVMTAYIVTSIILLKIYSFFVCALIISAFLIGQRYPEFLQIVIIEAVKRRYKRSRLDGIDTGKMIKKLDEIIGKEKLFADEDFSLKKLAYEIDLTPHQLSQLLNEKLKMNFNQYINLYRIKEAKGMLIDEPDRPILSIAYGVGFNSKSTFYRAFYQNTGKTPNEFRIENLAKKKS